mgnify:CR=1 FL=1
MMDTVKAAIAKDHDHITRTCLLLESGDNRGGIRLEKAGLSGGGDGLGNSVCVEALALRHLLRVRYSGDDRAICFCECADEFRLEHIAAAGV